MSAVSPVRSSMARRARINRTVLQPGRQRGMMGSNNHIITDSASALSDDRGTKGGVQAGRQRQPVAHVCKHLVALFDVHERTPRVHFTGSSAAGRRGGASAAALPSQVRGRPTRWEAPESVALRRIIDSLSGRRIRRGSWVSRQEEGLARRGS